MQKRKKINFINIFGLLLILGASLLTFKTIYNKYLDVQKTEQIIEQLFPNVITSNITTDQEESTISQSEISENTLSNYYLGYIELCNFGIKRLITIGTDRKTLDKGVVGLLNTSANLDDNTGNIILAGHNNKNVFGKLHSMQISDTIKIVTQNNTYYYDITEIHTINDDDFSYFNQTKDKKILTLITCKNNNKQRLIVIAELRG